MYEILYLPISCGKFIKKSSKLHAPTVIKALQEAHSRYHFKIWWYELTFSISIKQAVIPRS
jgi:hypothetical protein